MKQFRNILVAAFVAAMSLVSFPAAAQDAGASGASSSASPAGSPAAPVAPAVSPVAAAPAPRAPKRVKVRVLVAGSFGKPDDVVEVEAAVLASHDKAVRESSAGAEIDASPAAVAYAESLIRA